METELSERPALQAKDTTALTKEQQERLNQHKIRIRLENEQYLRRHPEVPVLLSQFIREALLKRPRNITEFAAEYFTDLNLQDKVHGKLEKSTDNKTQ